MLTRSNSWQLEEKLLRSQQRRLLLRRAPLRKRPNVEERLLRRNKQKI